VDETTTAIDSGNGDGNDDGSGEPRDRDAGVRSTPFLLTRAGTAGTLVAIAALYLVVMLVPVVGVAFGATAGRSLSGRIARIAPSTGAAAGLLVALVGCFLPPLRQHRGRWLALGYALALAGLATSFLLAVTAER
jgi:hypothetical protein